MEIIGFILPYFIEIVNSRISNKRMRFAVSLLFCLLATILVKARELKYTTELEFLQSFGLIVTGSITMYNFYFKGSPIEDTINTKFGPTEKKV